jgi:hypothetical protein
MSELPHKKSFMFYSNSTYSQYRRKHAATPVEEVTSTAQILNFGSYSVFGKSYLHSLLSHQSLNICRELLLVAIRNDNYSEDCIWDDDDSPNNSDKSS